MGARWNLSAQAWAGVLLDGATPEAVARDVMAGRVLPWSRLLVDLTADSVTVLDLGSGRGDHSALLALAGRKPTLLDWSSPNLGFSARLFALLGVAGTFCQADLTDPLPFRTASFDTVFSCGVLEYFDDPTIRSVVSEAFRVARKRVVMMVPNAVCLSYRLGKWHLERAGRWPWGGEVPFVSLRPYMRPFTRGQVVEYSVAPVHALAFLTMPGGQRLYRVAMRRLRMKDQIRPAPLRQGYLLVTVAEKASP